MLSLSSFHVLLSTANVFTFPLLTFSCSHHLCFVCVQGDQHMEYLKCIFLLRYESWQWWQWWWCDDRQNMLPVVVPAQNFWPSFEQKIVINSFAHFVSDNVENRKTSKEMLGECCRFWCSGGGGGGGESGEQTHTQLMPVLTSSPSVGQPQKSNIYNNLNVTTTEMITLFSLLAIKHPLYI